MLCVGQYTKTDILKQSDQFKLWCIFNNSAELLDSAIGFVNQINESVSINNLSDTLTNTKSDENTKENLISDVHDIFLNIVCTHYKIPVCIHIEEAKYLIRKLILFSNYHSTNKIIDINTYGLLINKLLIIIIQFNFNNY